jgi:hypothetical protein
LKVAALQKKVLLKKYGRKKASSFKVAAGWGGSECRHSEQCEQILRQWAVRHGTVRLCGFWIIDSGTDTVPARGRFGREAEAMRQC